MLDYAQRLTEVYSENVLVLNQDSGRRWEKPPWVQTAVFGVIQRDWGGACRKPSQTCWLRTAWIVQFGLSVAWVSTAAVAFASSDRKQYVQERQQARHNRTELEREGVPVL
ncbi:hypothetical protein DPEC_G00183200 [Dallia pectoralis]|uniref:Uncharacterized protein n=1 Tax=Dallia pectoralis TaxID=75939 RepID=A0ACC2GAV8_DALPE|nr:hypothetical protein DPEC_G00183200 [Dallia pectoralis]